MCFGFSPCLSIIYQYFGADFYGCFGENIEPVSGYFKDNIWTRRMICEPSRHCPFIANSSERNQIPLIEFSRCKETHAMALRSRQYDASVFLFRQRDLILKVFADSLYLFK